MRRKQTMKTKIILLTAALLGCFIGTAAQDVTILHMKDGTTKRYTNGVKWATSMDFYEYTPTKSALVNHSTTHENGYVCDWGVNQVLKMDGEYLIGLFWQDEVPYNFHSVSGVCFGTEPGLTVDNCQQKVYSSDAMVKLINTGGNTNSGSLWSLLNEHAHYMWIGPRKSSKAQMACEDKIYYGMQYELVTVDTLLNYITTPLEKGKTYYYRIFSEGKVLEGGQEKTVVFYDDERSFRVPRVMGDFGYYAYPCATEEALTAFANAHLDSLATLTWQQLEPLWNKWRATDEGKNYDLSADITSEKFDDGTGYRLNRIPDEFYTWAANREIVIDPFDVAEISMTVDNKGYDVFAATADSVANVDPKWGVPGGKYVRFLPVIPTVNHAITYRSDEVVAGVRYKLQFNFAPETDENADSTYFLPTKVRIRAKATSMNTFQNLSFPNDAKYIEVSATEATSVIVEGFEAIGMGLDLKYEPRVTSSELGQGTHNRIMRIAEIRLIPMKGE